MAILVDREEYNELQRTVLQLQTKYNAVLEDKQRWRNFALLSAATNLVAERAYTPEHAIRIARSLLTAIEGGVDSVEPG